MGEGGGEGAHRAMSAPHRRSGSAERTIEVTAKSMMSHPALAISIATASEALEMHVPPALNLQALRRATVYELVVG